MTADRPSNANVRVELDGEEWQVTVHEIDGQSHVQSFRTMEWAMNYAEGQRMRLGLEQVEIPTSPTPDEELEDDQQSGDELKEQKSGRARVWASRHAATDAAAQAIINEETAERRARTERLRKARLAAKDQQKPTGSKQLPGC